MKKYLLVLVTTIGCGINGNAQNIIIQQNNQVNKTEKVYIPIGGDVVRGIEIEILDKDKIRIENFNKFNVECNYSITFSSLVRHLQRQDKYGEWSSQYGWLRNRAEENQEGTKILLPNKPFILTRKENLQNTEGQSGDSYTRTTTYYRTEYLKGKIEVVSIGFNKL
jgi:hypothetical protein